MQKGFLSFRSMYAFSWMSFHECPPPVAHIQDELTVFITYSEVTSWLSRLDIPSQKVIGMNNVS